MRRYVTTQRYSTSSSTSELRRPATRWDNFRLCSGFRNGVDQSDNEVGHVTRSTRNTLATNLLEPIREVSIHEDGFAVRRLSMRRIMARRTKAAAFVA